MAMKVDNNPAANFSQRILDSTNQDLKATLKRIASGLRINSAADDAAGFGISERLRSLTNGYDQAQSNIQDSASALQVAEGGLTSITDTLQRMRDLSVQASNDTLTDADRAVIQTEMDQLVQEIDRQTAATQFNGQPLLSGQYAEGTGDFDVQSGANQGDALAVNINEVSANTLGVSGLSISTRDAASNAITSIDSAIASVSSTRATIGSQMNRLESANTFVGVARENTLAALSGIRDADMAAETSRLALGQILSQSGLSMLSQSNLNSQSVLKLLG